jgi:hypothetical protein
MVPSARWLEPGPTRNTDLRHPRHEIPQEAVTVGDTTEAHQGLFNSLWRLSIAMISFFRRVHAADSQRWL